MRNWSIPAGRIFGVELRIHLTFFFLLIFVWLTESTAKAPANPGRGLVLVGIILGSVVLHALGHSLVGMRAGVPPKAIILLPIGEVTLIDETQHPIEPGRSPGSGISASPWPDLGLIHHCCSPRRQRFVGCRPSNSLRAKPYVYSGNLPRSLVWSNLGRALFNLLPAYPAGRRPSACESCQPQNEFSSLRATRPRFHWPGLATLFTLVGMLWNIWLTMIGFFLFIAAQLEERSAVFSWCSKPSAWKILR